MRKIKLFLIFGMFLLSLNLVLANEDSNVFEQGKVLVDSRISCDKLTDNQLEIIGEYYMELMLSGELHELMDARLGGEGSESLRLAHINIGRMQYCGEYIGGQGYGWMMGGGYNVGPGMMYDLRNADYSNYNRMNRGAERFVYNFQNNWVVWLIELLMVIALVLFIVFLYKKMRKMKK